jgi:hypothetical protein
VTAPAFAQPEAGYTRPPTTGVAGQIAAMVIDDVKHAAANAPRSRQVSVGPSELGTPCTRRLAYRLLAWDRPNADTDPWAATIGTSVHAWMAAAYEAKNRQLGCQRYLIEHRVHLPGGISGSSDLYDRETCVNNDWKITSLDNIRKYRRSGPGQQYRIQGHLYGLGMLLAGEAPADIAITFLPRGGRIDGLYVWSEPFDPSVAADAIRRYLATRDALTALDPETHPERWALFPTAEAHCAWCPFYLPMSADLSRGCPGHRTARPVTTTKEK